MTLPTVFLSLSGHDENFVQAVHKLLPDSMAHFYPATFANGEDLIDAMEQRVESSAVFALFASRASLGSKWVNFEISKAKISSIVRDNFRVLVFVIDPDMTHSDLP